MKLHSFYEASKDLEVYKPGETPEELSARLGMPRSEVLKLDANENLFLPQMTVKEILREALEETDPRIYPSGERKRLREALGGYLGVSPKQIVLGGGSDQLIELLLHAFLRAGDEMLAVTPTFSVYGLTARAMGVGYRTVDLQGDFSLNVEETLSAVSPDTRILVLCSPNNPTGYQFARDKLLSLAENFQGLVVVDEGLRGVRRLLLYRGGGQVRQHADAEDLLQGFRPCGSEDRVCRVELGLGRGIERQISDALPCLFDLPQGRVAYVGEDRRSEGLRRGG